MDREFDRLNVKGLRELARNRGFRGYSKLRRAELIRLLSNPGPSILDEDIGITRDRVLIPTIAPLLPSTSRQRPITPPTSVEDLLKSLENVRDVPKSISPELEALKKKIEKLYRRQEKIEVKKDRSALKDWAEQYKIPGIPVSSPDQFLELSRPAIINVLKSKRGTKVKMVLQCYMQRYEPKDPRYEKVEANFSSEINEINLKGTDVYELYNIMVDRILENFQNFLRNGSGWTFHSVIHLKLHTVVYEPLRASGYIPLPDWISNKKACINMKNEDNKCFIWCILRHLNPKDKNAERVDNDLKTRENNLNMKGIEYPVTFHDIDRFERQNPEIGVNVFEYSQNQKITRIRATKSLRKHHVNLLFLDDGKKTHYVLIKNINALLRAQVSDHSDIKYCMLCMNHFGSERLLEKHMKYCSDHEAVNLKMPDKGTILKFINHHRKLKVPFTIYADFESVLTPIKTYQPQRQEESYTIKTQKHIPASFYYIIIFFDEVSEPILRKFTGKDADKKIKEMLTKDIKDLHQKYYQKPVPIKITNKEEAKHERETECYICNEEFTHENYKVKDHCHFTGKYRGAAHNKCNLKARVPDFTPVYFHNLSGYDAHLFIKFLGSTCGKIDCLPNNEEKYISFTKYIWVGKNICHKIRFLDSFKFMSSSLEKIVENLEDNQLNILSKYFTREQLPLVRRKGVFPYDYLDCFERLDETQLPPKEAFYSSLNKDHISDEDYEHAKKVRDAFGMKTFKDYLELYNKIDVLLLADVFENFRKVCLKHHEIDPCWYYTSPGLAYEAMLKKTGVEFELLSDVNMLHLFEKCKRGGVSTASLRYSEANNKYMGEDYDASKPTKYLLYIDANGLYAWAMSQLLPTKGFKWMSKEDLDKWDGLPCILEVDLEYPEELHDEHNCYPLAPEQLKIEKVKKLIPNLNDKENYVLHHEALKTCLSLGMKIKKIHGGIKFDESYAIKEYIDLNIKLRKETKNDFEKDFFKLMNNAVFGKTMENIRNRVNIELVNKTKSQRFKKLTAKPNYHHFTIFNEEGEDDLVAVHMKKTELYYNKPIYLGVSILHISKTLMQKTFYNYFKEHYGEKVKLCYTDTDSFILEIETEDVYEDMKKDTDMMYDMSGYPKEHPLYSEKNKKVLGMFKDELDGGIMTKFVGLGAKQYAYKKLDIKTDEKGNLIWEGKGEDKRCKGVKKSVVKNELNFKDYKDCLDTEKDLYKVMKILRSHKHDIFTEEINKKALSAQDDKRYILEDNIHTLAWGHHDIKI